MGRHEPFPVGTPLNELDTEVLVLLAQHLSNPEIAKRLHISHHTVKSRVTRIREKLGARTRVEAVRIATQQGVLACACGRRQIIPSTPPDTP